MRAGGVPDCTAQPFPAEYDSPSCRQSEAVFLTAEFGYVVHALRSISFTTFGDRFREPSLAPGRGEAAASLRGGLARTRERRLGAGPAILAVPQ